MKYSKFIIVFLMSMTLISLETVWTRVFSAEFFYTFAFLILSLAILGLGLGALALRMFNFLNRKNITALMLILSAIFALASPAIVLNIKLDFAKLFSASEMIYKFILSVILLSLPFFTAGIALAKIFKNNFEEIKQSSEKSNSSEEKQNQFANEKTDLNKSEKVNEFARQNEFELKKSEQVFAKDKPVFERPNTEQIVKTIKAAEMMKEVSQFIQQKDKTSIVLQITPEHLGAVKIALEVVDEIVTAKIEVNNQAAREVLENNAKQLQAQLNQNGVNVNSINISLSNFEHKQKQNFVPQRKKSFGYSEEREIEEKSSNEKRFGYNTIEYLA